MRWNNLSHFIFMFGGKNLTLFYINILICTCWQICIPVIDLNFSHIFLGLMCEITPLDSTFLDIFIFSRLYVACGVRTITHWMPDSDLHYKLLFLGLDMYIILTDIFFLNWRVNMCIVVTLIISINKFL